MIDKVNSLTIILVVVFAASLTAGLLSLLGARRSTHLGGEEKETMTRIAAPPSPERPGEPAPPAPQLEATMPTIAQYGPPPAPLPSAIHPPPGARPNRLQAIIDIMADGIETALSRMASGLFFICEALIKVFKWIFSVDG